MQVVPPCPLLIEDPPMDALDVIYRNVGGLDVHKKTVVACRRRVGPGGQVDKEVQTFGTTTTALLALVAWLGAWQVSHVAMESTGVYWKPVWNILEGHMELLLVNARHMKIRVIQFSGRGSVPPFAKGGQGGFSSGTLAKFPPAPFTKGGENRQLNDPA